jgi:hypothetical protein
LKDEQRLAITVLPTGFDKSLIYQYFVFVSYKPFPKKYKGRENFDVCLADLCRESKISLVQADNLSNRVCVTCGRKLRDFCVFSKELLPT